jgi:hypothetical protein
VAGAAIGLVVVLLVAGVVDDVNVQGRLHQGQQRATAARSTLARASVLVRSNETSARRTTAATDDLTQRLAQVQGELVTARQLVDQARTGVALHSLQLGDVHACAAGVRQAVAMLQSGHQTGAVTALSGVASVCEGLLSAQAGGPVYPYDFADPDVVVARGRYFAYGTNSTAGNIQIMESSDLIHWKKAGNALPKLPSWARTGYTWAPAVIHLKHTYVLYYAAARAVDPRQCLSVATAQRPQGPFVDRSSAPLECQGALGGSIDASPYVDGAGNPYLTWKSNGTDGTAPALWAQALNPRGTGLKGAGPVRMLGADQGWEAGVVEAPSMVVSGGSYFLFFSGNNWDSADYAVGVARCAGPLGPCAAPSAPPLLASQATFRGPGGECVFTDAQGHLEMAFAAWLPGAVGYPHSRLLFIRQLVVSGDQPRLGTGP